MSFELKEDIEVWDIINAAVELCDFVMSKHTVQTYEEFTCPYFRALVKELYWEVKDADG